MKRVAIFGSTGSIGESTLNIIRENPERFSAVTLVAGKNKDKLISQIEEFKPENVYIINENDAKEIKAKYRNLNVFCGERGMEEISELTDFDISVSALVGVAGLLPTYNMIKNGKCVALANKEVLVAGGELIMRTAKKSGALLLTVDSEHSAIMQCLNGEKWNKIEKILLTASGGPFFDKEITDDITPEMALSHPTWSMGPKVTIDSSTMMNKGFEVIEAKWLFGVEPSKIEVVVHRKSLVHSMVEFCDGTIMANIAPKSMQIPIAYALNFPERLSNNIEKLDIFSVSELKFERPDPQKFPCLSLAYKASGMGHSAQVVLNAANEVMVDAFLKGKAKYTSIPKVISAMIDKYDIRKLGSVGDILDFDRKVRADTREFINLR